MANPDVTRILASVPTGLWIGGEERSAASVFDVLSPATDEVLVSVANATAADAIAALDAACAVQESWAATPARDRGEILRSVFEAIIDRAEDFATLMTLEMGKVVAESMGEVRYGAEYFGEEFHDDDVKQLDDERLTWLRRRRAWMMDVFVKEDCYGRELRAGDRLRDGFESARASYASRSVTVIDLART